MNAIWLEKSNAKKNQTQNEILCVKYKWQDQQNHLNLQQHIV